MDFKGKGISVFHLESGEPFAVAMALYPKIGYKVIPNYGQYIGMNELVCLKKKI